MNPTLALVLLGSNGQPHFAEAAGPAPVLAPRASSSGADFPPALRAASVPRRRIELALERFSARWSVRFAPVERRARPARAIDVDAIVERVEAELDRARTALGASNQEEAADALRSAENSLLAHPELPAAAWLRAEQLTLAAELAEHVGSAGAAELRRRAAALEGPRAAPFRDAELGTRERALDAESLLELRGAAPSDRLEWDSTPVQPPFRTRTGEHVVRVLRGRDLLWASWVEVRAGQSVLELALPEIAACSADDLGGTTAGPRGPVAPPGVRCTDWAVGRFAPNGELAIALCHRSRCGDFHAQGPEPAAFRGPAQILDEPGWPSWATYAVAGAGTALITSVLLLGTRDRGSTPERRWVYDGFQSAR